MVQGLRLAMDPNLMFHYDSYTYLGSHTTASLFHPCQAPDYDNLKEI